MKRLQFSVHINAAPKVVWETLIEPDTYRAWTAPFAAGSYFEGSWAKGEEIRFLSPDGGGMLAVIEENRPYEFISVRHLGEIKDGVLDTASDAAKNWANAFENYTLKSVGTATELTVDMDVSPDMEEFMVSAWPKALARLRSLCERTP